MTEVENLHQQIAAMSNTIEALKRRIVHLNFELVDAMAAQIAHDGIHEIERHLDGQAQSQLPDGVTDQQSADLSSDPDRSS
jgi:hypothetical protein